MTNKYNGLSLFCSGGIGETYLHNTNVNIVLANELLKDRCDFYKEYYQTNDIIEGNICNEEVYNNIIERSKELNVDFVMATPPCQGMSKAGRMKFDDPRNMLFLKILDIIKEIQPKYVVIENVSEFLTSNYLTKNGEEKKILVEINEQINDLYSIDYNVLNAHDFNVPQSRKRAIMLISRKDLPPWNISDVEALKVNSKTVEDIIGYLPSLESGQGFNHLNNEDKKKFKNDENFKKWHKARKHNENHILWMKNTPTGFSAFKNSKFEHKPNKDGRIIKGYSTTYKRIQWDKPAPTITMSSGSISSQNNVHPGRELEDGTYSDARALTVYELILLTSLEKDWKVPTCANEKILRELFGECVPPRFMENIISSIPNKI